MYAQIKVKQMRIVAIWHVLATEEIWYTLYVFKFVCMLPIGLFFIGLFNESSYNALQFYVVS